MDEFALTVKTQDLTRVLKHLSKLDKTLNVELAFSEGVLTLSLGGTSHDLDAVGEWPNTVFVDRKWLTTLARYPFGEPITDLRVRDGRLGARDFWVGCSMVSEAPAERNRTATKSLPGSKSKKP